jgi:hypothetical protein
MLIIFMLPGGIIPQMPVTVLKTVVIEQNYLSDIIAGVPLFMPMS